MDGFGIAIKICLFKHFFVFAAMGNFVALVSSICELDNVYLMAIF